MSKIVEIILVAMFVSLVVLPLLVGYLTRVLNRCPRCKRDRTITVGKRRYCTVCHKSWLDR